MPDPTIADAVALCRAWAAHDTMQFARDAKRLLEKDAFGTLGAVTHVAYRLAVAISAEATRQGGEEFSVDRVLEQLLLNP